MDSLRELAEKFEPGHYLAWQAEDAKSVEQTRPKKVETVTERGDIIRIDATGSGNGKYHFTVDQDGNSESFYHDPSKGNPDPMGAIIFAELTGPDEPVTVKRGFYDSLHNSR